MKVTKR